MAGGHGGRRAGAGRKRGPVPPTHRCLVLERCLSAYDTRPKGRMRRCATALAASGVCNALISQALAIDESQLIAKLSNELQTGRLLLERQALGQLWRAAESVGRA